MREQFGQAISRAIVQVGVGLEQVQLHDCRRQDVIEIVGHTAGQLPDPTLQVGIDNLPVQGSERFSTTADSMTMKRIGIGQEWVSRDKRSARAAPQDLHLGVHDAKDHLVLVIRADLHGLPAPVAAETRATAAASIARKYA